MTSKRTESLAIKNLSIYSTMFKIKLLTMAENDINHNTELSFCNFSKEFVNFTHIIHFSHSNIHKFHSISFNL
jgi:hypothetical protein